MPTQHGNEEWYDSLEQAIEMAADEKGGHGQARYEIKKIEVLVGHHSPSHIDGWRVTM